MRFSAFASGLILLLAITSCGHSGPNDLRLEGVYQADLTAIPRYKLGVARGFTQPAGLIIELSTSDSYPDGALVSDGFCGERLETSQLRDGRLYKIARADRSVRPEGGLQWRADRYRYFAVVEIDSKPIDSSDSRPPYNLEHDRRDICVQTVAGVWPRSRVSNTVEVPRLLINRALQWPIRPRTPQVITPPVNHS